MNETNRERAEAVGAIQRIIDDNHRLNITITNILRQWQNLSHEDRVSLGRTYPKLVDALIALEGNQR